jgi:hypothetical protein
MDNSQYILRNTKAKMKIAYRVKTGKTAKDAVHLPVSMDMIQGHHAAGRRGMYTTIDLAVYTAEVLAYTTLSRVSEYLYTGDGTHTLMSEDVQFEMQDGTITTASAAYMTDYSKVTGCIVNI